MAGRIVTSTINDDTGVLATQNGMTGIAKAWINYNAVAGTIRSSFNVSSVVINSAGDITTNFTIAMPNANYAWAISQQLNGTGNNDTGASSTARNLGTSAWGTTFIRTNTMGNTNLSQENPLVLTIAIFSS
jgi:hypothetical protein